ncbi:MAG: DUF1189 family protein [Succinivibrio sp.]|nr:DUF1189 family protein [Succinivibrio sp.]
MLEGFVPLVLARQLLITPLQALYSRRFYIDVLLRLRGSGLKYLILLCVVLAVPVALRSMTALSLLKSLEIPALIGQIPQSYLSQSGVLTPNDSAQSFKELKNSQGRVVMIYNSEDAALDEDQSQAAVILNSRSFTVRGTSGRNEFPYSALFRTGSTFEPYAAATLLDSVLNMSFMGMWGVLTMWLFAVLTFNALISALCGRLLMLLMLRMRVNFGGVFRLCAYASTLPGLIMVAQTYVFVQVPYAFLLLLPCIYVLMFMAGFKKELGMLGVAGFKAKYGLNNLKVAGGKDGDRTSSGGGQPPSRGFFEA